MQPERAALDAAPQPSRRPRQDRVTACCEVLDLEAVRRARGISQRAVAREADVPRSTWQARANAADDDGVPAGWQPFLESEAGLHFLTRLLVVLLVCCVLKGGCSVARVADCLAALHLSKLLASSPTSLRRLLDRVLTEVVAFGQAQRATLCEGMPHREVVAAVDENFHWDQMLLVAMDLVSGFLFCERPSASRDGASWNRTLAEATEGLNVEVIALTCDQAKGLRRCAELRSIPVGHDVLHVQQPLCRALARPMARKVEQAQQALVEARQAQGAVQEAQAEWASHTHGPGRPPSWSAHLERARTAVSDAEATVTAVQDQHAAIRREICALSEQQHPVDLLTGQLLGADEVRARQEATAQALCEQAGAAGLGTRTVDAVNKVFRCLDGLGGIVAWWRLLVTRRVATLGLSEASAQWVETILVPALYVRHHVRLGRDAVVRGARRTLAETLWKGVEASPWWSAWSEAQRRQILGVVQSCVESFPRASSCVEGRNGQDALCLHQHHRISETLRQARGVLHNYVLQRADGTTAAERFFGKKPDDLIEFLCARLTLPARGRLRGKKPRPTVLALAG